MLTVDVDNLGSRFFKQRGLVFDISLNPQNFSRSQRFSQVPRSFYLLYLFSLCLYKLGFFTPDIWEA